MLPFQQLRPQELQAASVSEFTGASRHYCRRAERRQMGRRLPDTCAQGGDPLDTCAQGGDPPGTGAQGGDPPGTGAQGGDPGAGNMWTVAQRPPLRHPGPAPALRVWDQWTLTPFLGLPGSEGLLLLLWPPRGHPWRS